MRARAKLAGQRHDAPCGCPATSSRSSKKCVPCRTKNASSARPAVPSGRPAPSLVRRCCCPVRAADRPRAGRVRCPVLRSAIAEERDRRRRLFPGSHQANHRRRRPFPFAARHGHGAVGQRPSPSGLRKPVANTSTCRPSAGDADQSLLARRRVEPPLAVALQPADKIVAAGRREHAIREALVVVGLAVAVQIVQARDLIAPQHINLIVGHDQSQRLVQARGEPPPADVAATCRPSRSRATRRRATVRDQRGAVGQKIVIAAKEQRPAKDFQSAGRSCRSRTAGYHRLASADEPCRAIHVPQFLRPLRRAAAECLAQRVLGRRRHQRVRTGRPSTQAESSISTSPRR